MNDVKAFIDTNLFIYLYSDTDASKRECVSRTINQYERFVSTQVLKEKLRIIRQAVARFWRRL